MPPAEYDVAVFPVEKFARLLEPDDDPPLMLYAVGAPPLVEARQER